MNFSRIDSFIQSAFAGQQVISRTMQQNSEKFSSEFAALQQAIESKLDRIKANDGDDRKLLLDESLEQFKSLKDLLDLNGSDLPQYVRKVSQEKINQLQQSINDAKRLIQPKKTFKFNAKRQQQIKQSTHGKPLVADQVDSEQPNLEQLPQFSFGLRDKRDEHLQLRPDEVDAKDIQLCNLVNCVVAIHGNPSTVHIIDCKNSRISCGPVSTSVFIDRCSDSVFQLFCQQLRVHNTYDCTFHLHVCTRGIIEDSSRLRFGRYEFDYEQLESDIVRSKLNRSVNNWDKIEDFNWLVKNKQSPNWQLLTS